MTVMGASSAARTPRVREMARDAVVQMLFSATVSVGLVALLVLLAHGIGR